MCGGGGGGGGGGTLYRLLSFHIGSSLIIEVNNA